MSPHGDLAWVVDDLYEGSEGAELLVVLAILNANLEESVVIALSSRILIGDSSELLVRWVVWRGNIVGEEDGVCNEVSKLDKLVVAHNAVLVVVGWNNLPVVVGVVEWISGNLLTLGRNSAVFVSQRISIWVRVKVGLGVLVSQNNRVHIMNWLRVGGHEIVAESLLELWAHKVISWAGAGENGEVHLEPEEVEEEWDKDESENAGEEVLAEVDERQSSLATVDIEQVPKVNGDCSSNGEESEQADIFGGDDAAEREAGNEEPLPPLAAEWNMAKLVELDVGEQRAGHGEYQGSIKENEASLSYVGIVEKDEAGSNDASWQSVARLPHNVEDNWDGQRAEQCWQSAVCNIWDLVLNVGVSNVVEVEAPIIANKVSDEGEEQLCERWVHIEEVSALKVVRCKLRRWQISSCPPCSFFRVSLSYLSKVHLVKDDLVRMADAPESGRKC